MVSRDIFKTTGMQLKSSGSGLHGNAGETAASMLIYIVLGILALVMLYPVVYMFSLSFSSSSAADIGKVKLLPVDITFDSYRYVLSDSRIGRAYINTVVYATLGTFFSIMLTSLIAYPLTVSTFSLKKFITVMLAITLFFDGGLIPYYITVKSLGLVNTVWVMVIPGSVGAWNVIIYRTFFKEIPSSLRESAVIDGANDLRVLIFIILPLSKPLLAVMGLFSMVGIWNDYFTALIFLHRDSMLPLQMILRSLVIQTSMRGTEETAVLIGNINASVRTIRAAVIIVAMIPVMCIYPFLQKYFTKGLLIGSIKG